jgi:uncharacterized membrane protein
MDVPPRLGAPIFQAVIIPQRSLSPRAARRVAIVVGAMCCLTAAAVAIAGAWPVVGFTGAELLLASLLLRLHLRGGNAREMLLLDDAGLSVVRTDASGRRREVALPGGWLSVRLQERPGRVPALKVVGRGVEEEVAASLGEAEKRDLAAALAAALEARRNPRFDNPQLKQQK